MPTTPHGRRWTTSRQPISHVGRSRHGDASRREHPRGPLFEELERRGRGEEFGGQTPRPAGGRCRRAIAAITSSARSTEQRTKAADRTEPIADRQARPGFLREPSGGDFGCEGRHGDRIQRGRRAVRSETGRQTLSLRVALIAGPGSPALIYGSSFFTSSSTVAAWAVRLTILPSLPATKRCGTTRMP